MLALFDTSPLYQFSKFNNFLWVCWCLSKSLPYLFRNHLDIAQTTLNEKNNYKKGNISENQKFHSWKCIFSGVFHQSQFWHLSRKTTLTKLALGKRSPLSFEGLLYFKKFGFTDLKVYLRNSPDRTFFRQIATAVRWVIFLRATKWFNEFPSVSDISGCSFTWVFVYSNFKFVHNQKALK